MASRTGRCLCGEVTYELAVTPTSYGACHCAMCRRWTGSLEFGIETMPGGATFEGAALKTYKSSDWAERGFCGTCGSNLFWRLTVDGPMNGLMSITAGTLDDMEGLAFDTEVYVDHAVGAHEFAKPETRKRMTEAEVLAMVNEGGA